MRDQQAGGEIVEANIAAEEDEEEIIDDVSEDSDDDEQSPTSAEDCSLEAHQPNGAAVPLPVPSKIMVGGMSRINNKITVKKTAPQDKTDSFHYSQIKRNSIRFMLP